MKVIALSARDPSMLERLAHLVPDSAARVVHVLPPGGDRVEALRALTPDLVVHFMDAADDNETLFAALDDDPWLSTISFVLLCDDVDATICRYGRYGVAYFLESDGFERNLPRVLDLLLDGLDRLTGARLMKRLATLSGEISIETDILLVPYYAAFFANYLHKEGHLSHPKRLALHLALTELLVNAMEHGNAQVTYAEKTAWMATDRSIQELVEQRMSAPPYAGRRVLLDYQIGPTRSIFRITDEGEGFDTSAALAPPSLAALAEAHGRGILLSSCSVDRLSYNAKGNSVEIELQHDGEERAVPQGFVDCPPVSFDRGDVVFSEGEPGDVLYYVVSGLYSVQVKGKEVYTASADDVFLGEMSFLLGNRRTATVVARSAGRLVAISHESFMRTMRAHPDYAIFLCKLLARRLRQANERYADVAGTSG